ncbi:MAG TPA: hypothetical protein VHF89_11210 [Solirubrobacteraceae bacterium]|nr:hypothetical protein [Solirubrobacteraceae bacterium]
MSRSPAVSCSGCGFAWNSAAMAEGLRLLGSCPKCGGALIFSLDAPEPPRAERVEKPARSGDQPHLVLGIPRR